MRWISLALVAVAFAWPQQGPGWEENSHYLGARAIADGRAEVDDDRHRIGDLGTGDLAFFEGHYYMDKAPGLAFATAPVFALVRAAGMRTDGDPTQVLWALGLAGTVLPASLLLLLVGRRADELAPGWGTMAAVTLGLGTLLTPYATLFFSHALSAFLGFAAFTLAWRGRRGSAAFVAAAGLVAALAVTTEYPNGLAAVVIGAYAASGVARLRSAAAYAGGLVVGLVPLLAHNTWVFGSPLHVSYEHSLSGSEAMDEGFFGIGVPSLRTALEMLFSEHGLLVLSPALAASVAGLVVLARTHRAEALTIAAIALLYGGWAAGYFNPFGGLWPGPRYLVFVLPFLALPLALAFRRFPLTTTALALIGIVEMVSLTATNPHAAYHQQWFERIADREFPTTALAVVGVTGWYAMAPFFLAAIVAIVAALRTTPSVVPERADVWLAGGAVAAWSLVAAAAPKRSELGGPGLDYASYWVIGVLAASALAFTLARRLGTPASWRPSLRPTRTSR